MLWMNVIGPFKGWDLPLSDVVFVFFSQVEKNLHQEHQDIKTLPKSDKKIISEFHFPVSLLCLAVRSTYSPRNQYWTVPTALSRPPGELPSPPRPYNSLMALTFDLCASSKITFG